MASQSLDVETKDILKVQLFPNPTTGDVFIKGLENKAEIEVCSLEGRLLKTINIDNKEV